MTADPRTIAIEALTEDLAAIEHEQWMAWASTIAMNESISPERLARWEKSMVPYADLPDDVKEQDREWARKVLTAPPVAELLRKAAAYDSIREVSQDHWLDIMRLAAIGRAVEGLRDSTTIEYDPSATDYPWCVDVGSRHSDGADLPSAIKAALGDEKCHDALTGGQDIEEQRARPVNAEDLLEVARAELKTAVMLEGTYCAQRDAALAREKALVEALRDIQYTIDADHYDNNGLTDLGWVRDRAQLAAEAALAAHDEAQP